jgi:N4-gp56 family major capsid protein
MATTSYGVNDALAVKLFSKELAVEALKATEVAPLFGKSANSIIQIKTDTQKGKGDKITFGLRMQLSGDGFTEGETAEGNGESLTTYSDSILINELGHVVGVKSDNTIDAQRVHHNLRDEAKDGLVDWWAKRIAVSTFNQLCGNTATSGTGFPSSSKYTGLNTVTAPSSGRILRAGGLATDALVGADSTAIFDITLIDKCVEIAKTGGSGDLMAIRPAKVDGDEYYVMYLHPSQVTSMRTNTSTGQWQDIQKAAMAGSAASKNPIFTGALGVYHNVVLRESQNLPLAVNASTSAAIANTRRAVFLGAQAGVAAFGMDKTLGRYRWNEELYDHKRKLEVSGWTIWGMKKTIFNSSDFGSIVVSTYAANAA